MDSLPILLRCVALLADEGDIRNILVEFALYQSYPFASFVKDLILEANSQIILEFLFTFCVIFIFGLLTLDFECGFLFQLVEIIVAFF